VRPLRKFSEIGTEVEMGVLRYEWHATVGNGEEVWHAAGVVDAEAIFEVW
jgi:hypothetical protein